MKFPYPPVCALAALLAAGCVTQEPEIVQVHRAAPLTGQPLVGVRVTSARPVDNVRISVAGKAYPRSPSGVLYLRLAPGSHRVDVSYDVVQGDGSLARRSVARTISVPNTLSPVSTSIHLP
jgi:hypothetical protein